MKFVKELAGNRNGRVAFLSARFGFWSFGIVEGKAAGWGLEGSRVLLGNLWTSGLSWATENYQYVGSKKVSNFRMSEKSRELREGANML